MCASQLCILSLPLFSPLPSSFLLLQMQFRSLFSLLAQFDKPRQFAADVALFADCLHYVRTIHTHIRTHTHIFASLLCFSFMHTELGRLYIYFNQHLLHLVLCDKNVFAHIWCLCVCVCVFVVVAVCVCVRCLVLCFVLLAAICAVALRCCSHCWEE